VHRNDKPTPAPPTTKPPVEPKVAKVEPKDDPRPAEPVTTPPQDAAKPAAPTPTGSATSKPGTIDVAATRAAIRPHLGAIQRCFDRAKMDDLSLAGGVTIRIAIGGDGAVTKAEVAKSSLGSPSTEHCITQEISTWHLPKPSGDVASSLLYPFVFE
jgi:outer membrane biosynthesis protein TonB